MCEHKHFWPFFSPRNFALAAPCYHVRVSWNGVGCGELVFLINTALNSLITAVPWNTEKALNGIYQSSTRHLLNISLLRLSYLHTTAANNDIAAEMLAECMEMR